MAHYKRNNSVAMGEFKRSEDLFFFGQIIEFVPRLWAAQII